MLHSNLGSAERRQEWERIRDGEAQVVIGPRSAVFAPARNLGLIVVDEEQDGAYKQDTRPRYSGRDLALVRAQTSTATALLVSATPSLETRLNVERGRYRELRLTARVGVGALPEAILVDLREEPGDRPRRPGDVAFSRLLVQETENSLQHGEQVILLRNRRGYSPQLLCRACGENMACEDCGLPKSYHRREGRLICHYCGGHAPVPRVCPECGEDALQPIGAGTERVEEEVRKRFPEAAVDVLDRDTTRRVGGAAAVLERFRSGRTNILIGTQMISKGHHFPNVALAAVLTADSYLGFPDFRAAERSYALLTQLAGRAGRGERAGRFVIQTYHPDHYAIQAVLNQDDEAFASHEMRFRRTFHYPPFTRMVQLVVRDRNRDRGRARIEELAAAARRHELAAGVRFSGPAPAPPGASQGAVAFPVPDALGERSGRQESGQGGGAGARGGPHRRRRPSGPDVTGRPAVEERRTDTVEWLEKPTPVAAEALAKAGYGLLAAPLARRGVGTPSEADAFLAPHRRGLHDPFLLHGMEEAVERLRRACRDGATVAVVGDYDVDGVTACALLTAVLHSLGAEAVPILPNRLTEGYGFQLLQVEKAHRAGASLIVTVGLRNDFRRCGAGGGRA